jgi:hypothetical protein
MTNTKQAATHTPEPWFVQPSDNPGGLLIKPIPGQVVAQCDQVPEMEANASRICAAVNACKGISTESLEQGVVRKLLEALEAQEMAEWDAQASRRKGYFARARELRRAALAAARGTLEAGAKIIPAPPPGLPTPFDAYEIHGMKRLPPQGQEEEPVGRIINNCEQVSDAEAEFWSLFGHIPSQGLDCIGDFATREHAEEVLARITGRPSRVLPRKNR